MNGKLVEVRRNIMKVLLVNGSCHKNGCTNRALEECAAQLREEGVKADIFWIGNKPIGGCLGCGACSKLGKCVQNDTVNSFMEIAPSYDGFIFGAAVHYASANGAMSCFMDRVFYSCPDSSIFYLKPAAAVTSARRAGTTATLDQLHKHFFLASMPIITASYWNEVHGSCAADVEQDKEGLQTMRNLARNMAWFLKIKEAGAGAGIPMPEKERGNRTDFIR